MNRLKDFIESQITRLGAIENPTPDQLKEKAEWIMALELLIKIE
jgi:hypothetical protein